MIRRVLGAVVVAIGVLVALPVGAASAEPPAALPCGSADGPVEVTTDVVLTEDLTCDEAMWALAPGVTLDLGGHTLTIQQPNDCRRLQWGECNLDVGSGEVSNGRITGASVRIRDGAVHHVVMTGGSIAITLKGSITSSILDGTPLTLASGGTLASSWVVRGTGIELYNTEFPVTGLSIRNNLVLSNTGAGIRTFGRVYFDDDISGEIESNLIAYNTGDGIVVGGVVQSLGSLAIARNVIMGNGGSGIVVSGDASGPVSFGGGPVTLTANTTVFNKGHGIYAPAVAPTALQIVDGGRNVAFANRLRPGCVGVRC